MRVLMLGPSKDSMGGIATVIKNFYKYFNVEGIEIIYMQTWREGSLINRLLFTIKTLIKLIMVLLREKIDLLHIHVAQDGSFYRKSLILLIGKIMRKKVIFHVHASQFDKFYLKSNKIQKKYIQLILNLADRIIVLSEEWQQYFSKITNNKIIILHNAVTVNEYRYNNSGKIISFMGRLCKRKGIYDILEVSSEFLETNKEYKLYLCGDGDIEEVKKSIKQKRLENRIVVTGWINEKEKNSILKNTVINILPSYNEGMPMAILETMALGIPNIASNVGGILQVIKNRENGIVITPGNKDDLNDSINKLIADQEKRQEMSINAYNQIKNNYSIDNYNKKVEQLYLSLL